MKAAEYPHEMWCPSIDVCAICADSECDGIGCISDLDGGVNDDLGRHVRRHERDAADS